LSPWADFPWNTLDSPIIDIGGGIGSIEMSLLKDPRNHSLKFTIFDIPKTIEHAKKVCFFQYFEIARPD
jgi:hypothetical protein